MLSCDSITTPSATFRTYEALCSLSYETPYLSSERGRSGRPKQAVRHTYSGQLGIVKILRYIRSDMYTASSTNKNMGVAWVGILPRQGVFVCFIKILTF